MPNSGHGGCPGTRVMTIFGPYVDPHFPNIEYFAVYGSTGPGRYLIFFLVKFPVECRQNHVWGPPGARVMSIFVKTYICVKVELGHNHGWKER